MANKRVSELAPITTADLSTDDLLLLADVTAHESKKVTLQDFSAYVLQNGRITGSVFGSASYALNASHATSASWAPVQVSSSYSSFSGFAWNSNTASLALFAISASYSKSGSYAITASYAMTSSVQLVFSSAFADMARSASYLIYTPGFNNGTASYAITASYALSGIGSSVSASHANVSDLSRTASFLQWTASQSNGTASFSVTSSNAITASFTLTASYAAVASIGVTTNFQSSASYASSSISSSFASVATLALTSVSASYALQNPYINTHGVYSAITQSITSSQLDVVSLVSGNRMTSSFNVHGTLIVPFTASTILSESISLHWLNRTTGRDHTLDMSPIYVNLGPTGTTLSGTIQIPFGLLGQHVSSQDSYMLYVTASSNKIRLAPNRNVKFGIDINVGTFSVEVGQPLNFYTDNPDYITFYSSDGGPFVDTYPNIAITGSQKILVIDLSTVFGGAHNIWTMTNLTTVTCSNALSLTNVSGMPASLVTMSFQTSSITVLQDLDNTSLTRFVCTNNLLTSLPQLPTTMSNGYFNCSQNAITSFPTIPYGLKEFYCDFNSVSTPPSAFPTSIVSMSFSNNSNLGTTWLTTLPTALTYFWCRNNPSLASLPTTPTPMLHMDISNNNLTGLSMDNTCADLVSNGLSSGSLDISGNQALLPTTLGRITTLLSRAWSVNY